MKQIEGQVELSFKRDGTCYIERTRRKKENCSRIRDSLKISKDEYVRLMDYCKNPENYAVVEKEAKNTSGMIAEYIVLSVTKNLSYDRLEAMWDRGEIERPPIGRSDFYGYRRMFFRMLDEKLRKEEELKQEENVDGKMH